MNGGFLAFKVEAHFMPFAVGVETKAVTEHSMPESPESAASCIRAQIDTDSAEL